MKLLIHLGFLLVGLVLSGQSLNSKTYNNGFGSSIIPLWIHPPSIDLHAYGVYHFKKEFSLHQKPSEFVIHISADNRYRLYVNGKYICNGPSRGDLQHWFYETVDIANALGQGENLIAVQVWNMGERKPMAQVSHQTGLFVKGKGEKESIADTDTTWSVMHNNGYYAVPFPRGKLGGYTIGDCDSVRFDAYPWGWESGKDTSNNWVTAGIEKDARSNYYYYPRQLTPRTIPLLEERKEELSKIVRLEGMTSDKKAVAGLRVPPHSKVKILLDKGLLTIGYPAIEVSGGARSEVKITYAESLYDASGLKGNRSEVGNKKINGYYDVFVPDGKQNRVFTPLWLRMFRYVELSIETKDEALLLNDVHNIFTAYPFEQKGTFESNDPELKKIWEVGWQTVRLSSLETFVDGPYWEQVQYIGDSRIEAIISLYASGDDRLMRNCIDQFNWSRQPNGLTLDSYPREFVKIIPTYSLLWIGMIHDYYMYREDDAFIRQYLTGIQGVLEWFEQRLDRRTGMLGELQYWNFIDWAWSKGIPPGGTSGNSALVTLQYVYALQYASDLFDTFGKKENAAHYHKLAKAIKEAVYKSCYNSGKKLFSDTPEKTSFSQHTQIMAVLTGAVNENVAKSLMHKVLTDTTLTPATLYFRFYLNRALQKTGLGNEYLSTLSIWKKMLENGLTTFPETQYANARSDCHGWSASPTYDLLSIVCGIEPASPGFKTVRIKPNLGLLKNVSGVVPHPSGQIKVDFKSTGEGVEAEVELPQSVTGVLIFRGKEVKLKGGKQWIRM